MTQPNHTITRKSLKVGSYTFESVCNIYKHVKNGKETHEAVSQTYKDLLNDERAGSFDFSFFRAQNGEGRSFYQLVKLNDIINLLTTDNKSLCEILNKYPKKLYFDIDGKNDEYELTLKDVKKTLKKYFNLKKKDYTISGYLSKEKNSFHIVCKKYVFNNEDEVLKFKDILNNLIKIEKNKREQGGKYNKTIIYFDPAVYSKNRLMKCIYQSKIGGNVAKPMHPKKDYDLKDFIIGSFIPDKIKSYVYTGVMPEKLETLTKTIIKPVITEKLYIPQEFTKKELNDAYNLLELTPIYINDKEDQPHQHRWKVGLFCFFNGIKEDDFINWFMKTEPTKQRLKKVQKFWDEFPKHEKFKITISSYKKYLSQWYPELCEDNHFTAKFINSFDLKCETENIDRIEQTHFYKNKKALIFNIGMGGGKTTTTLQYLKNSNDTFVWLAPRRTLVENTSHRMNEEFKLNHISHLKVGQNKGKLTQATKLLICNQSLHYLSDKQNFKTVIIDEIETVLLSWLGEKTHGENMESNFKRFCHLLSNANKIILLDAFTTKRTINLLNNLGIKNDDMIIYQSKYTPEKKIININQNINDIIEKIADDVFNKRKCYIFYPFKGSSKDGHYSIQEFDVKIKKAVVNKYKAIATTAEEKLKYMEDENLVSSVLYFSQSDATEHLDNVNEIWKYADYIITTSSITVGVNYEGLDYSNIYLLISGFTNESRDVIQSSMRIRKPQNNIFNIFFFDMKTKTIIQFPQYYEKNDAIYNALVCDNLAEIQADFKTSFLKFCSLTNYHINDKDFYIAKRKKFVNELFKSKMLIDYEGLKPLGDITVNEYEKKIYSSDANIYERMMVERYYFDKTFRNLPKDDRALIWNTNTRSFFKGIKNDLINKILSDNDVEHITELNPNKLEITDDTFNLLKSKFSTEITKKDKMARETINEILGFKAIETNKDKKDKARGFKLSETLHMLYDLHLKKDILDKQDIENGIIEFID
jgi:hypothetical protein